MVTSRITYYPETGNLTESSGFSKESAAIDFELQQAIRKIIREANNQIPSGAIADIIINNYEKIEVEMKKDRRSENRFVQTSIIAPVHKPASVKK